MKLTLMFRRWLGPLGLPVAAVATLLAVIRGVIYLCGGDIGEPCHDSASCSPGLLCAEGACRLPCELQNDCPDDCACRTPKTGAKHLAGVGIGRNRVCVRSAQLRGETANVAPALDAGGEDGQVDPLPLQDHREQIRRLHFFSELHPTPPWTEFEERWRKIHADTSVSDHKLRELLTGPEG